MKHLIIMINKTLICFFFALFVSNIVSAQQGGSNLKTTFPNGTILSSDNATIRGELRTTNKPYDENIIGVFNDSKEAENNDMFKAKPVVSAGITSIKYCSENGKIKKGDLLTSSSELGVAMRATKSGIVVGIALEDAVEISGLIKIRVLIQYVKQ
jgi:hypothetical protein